MADESTNTGLIVVIIILVVALLGTVYYFTRGGGAGHDAEMEIKVNTGDDSTRAAPVANDPSRAVELPSGLRFVA